MRALGILLSATLLNAPATLGQTVRHVPEDFPTIQAAIDAAQPGDTVRIGKGEWAENLRIMNKSNLTIEGVDRAECVLRPSGPVNGVWIGSAKGVKIRSLTLNGDRLAAAEGPDSSYAGIMSGTSSYRVASMTIENCPEAGLWVGGTSSAELDAVRIVGSGGYGIAVNEASTASGASVTLHKNHAGLTVWQAGSSARLGQSSLTDNRSYGVFIGEGAAVTLSTSTISATPPTFDQPFSIPDWSAASYFKDMEWDAVQGKFVPKPGSDSFDFGADFYFKDMEWDAVQGKFVPKPRSASPDLGFGYFSQLYPDPSTPGAPSPELKLDWLDTPLSGFGTTPAAAKEPGIDPQADGVRASGSGTSLVMEDCTVRGYPASGVTAWAGARVSLTRTKLLDLGSDGASLSGLAAGSRIEHCEASGNKGSGIVVRLSDGVVVRANTLNRNSVDGLRVEGVTGFEARSNTSSNNSRDGIVAYAPFGGNITENIALDNGHLDIGVGPGLEHAPGFGNNRVSEEDSPPAPPPGSGRSNAESGGSWASIPSGVWRGEWNASTDGFEDGLPEGSQRVVIHYNASQRTVRVLMSVNFIGFMEPNPPPEVFEFAPMAVDQSGNFRGSFMHDYGFMKAMVFRDISGAVGADGSISGWISWDSDRPKFKGRGPFRATR